MPRVAFLRPLIYDLEKRIFYYTTTKETSKIVNVECFGGKKYAAKNYTVPIEDAISTDTITCTVCAGDATFKIGSLQYARTHFRDTHGVWLKERSRGPAKNKPKAVTAPPPTAQEILALQVEVCLRRIYKSLPSKHT